MLLEIPDLDFPKFTVLDFLRYRMTVQIWNWIVKEKKNQQKQTSRGWVCWEKYIQKELITEDFSLTLRSLKWFIDPTQIFQISKTGYTSMWAYKWPEVVTKN